jgi:arabinose-5-phosphate isomerase
MTAVIAAGRRVLLLEAEAVGEAGRRLDARFAEAVALLREALGRVIVSGVGKSGLVGRKIAATLTSTGTAATFLHPVDSLHGDLGIVGGGDVAILLSKSGETEELFGLVEMLGRQGVPIIAITGGLHSTLARAATVVLDAGVAEEACPHDLAPTASTTVALALGDALAVALLEEKGFSREAFATLHPGGRLGRKLLLRVRDVMLPLPATLVPEESMGRAVELLAHHRGIAIVARGRRLLGVITAGDLSRLAETGSAYLELEVEKVMTKTPKTVAQDELAAAAVGLMERHGIMALPVENGDGGLVGVVHLHDLMRAGAV